MRADGPWVSHSWGTVPTLEIGLGSELDKQLTAAGQIDALYLDHRAQPWWLTEHFALTLTWKTRADKASWQLAS